MECMYLNDIHCYDSIVEELLLQPDIEQAYQSHIDDALLLLSSYGPPEVEFHETQYKGDCLNVIFRNIKMCLVPSFRLLVINRHHHNPYISA